MKLVSCEVENFGGLHQQTFSFDQGLSVIQQENGWGKTTLATFIRCMLYGMPRGNSKDLAKDLRRKYAPWQGGNYGGQLVICVGAEEGAGDAVGSADASDAVGSAGASDAAGKNVAVPASATAPSPSQQRTYRIERSFGRTPKEDTLAVYDQDTGHPSTDLGEVPGITLFGLDADSFERSAYLPQNRLADTLATGDIKAKLGNLVDNTNKTRNFETAMEALRKARAQRIPYRGQNGDHAQLTAAITRLNEEIAQLSTLERELARVQDRDQRLLENMEQHRASFDEARVNVAQASKAASRRGLALECKRLDDARTQAKAHYDEQAKACTAYVSSLSSGTLSASHAAKALPQKAFPQSHEIHQALEAKKCLDQATQAQPAQNHKGAFLAGVMVGVVLLAAGAALALLDILGIVHVFAGQLYVGAALAVVGVVAALCCALKMRTSKQLGSAFQKTQVARETLDNFCATYHLDPGALSQQSLCALSEKVNELQRLHQQFIMAEQAFNQFVEVHGMCSWTHADEENYRALQAQDFQDQQKQLYERHETLLQDHARDVQRIQALQEKIQQIPLLNDELQKLTAQRREMENDVATFDATMSYLEQAKEHMCENYAGPIQEQFQRYFELLTGEKLAFDTKKMQVDTDFRLSFSQLGATRAQENLSAGYADLVMVCMRMALVRVLYKKEPAFVIMDDPFVNIDDDMMQRACDLLKAFSKEQQIIYFTCSNSRNPLAR